MTYTSSECVYYYNIIFMWIACRVSRNNNPTHRAIHSGARQFNGRDENDSAATFP